MLSQGLDIVNGNYALQLAAYLASFYNLDVLTRPAGVRRDEDIDEGLGTRRVFQGDRR
jgi:hypothetical protein